MASTPSPDLASASPSSLGRLGRNGIRLRELAQGIDHRAVEARGKPKSLGWERTLDVDVTRQTDIEALLKQGAVRVAQRLKTKKMVAYGIRIKLKTTSFDITTRQMALSIPSADATAIWRSALVLLKELAPKDTYRLVGLSAFDLSSESQGIQMALPLTQP